MSDHAPRTIERHCDVAAVGGSAAGLAAALQLGRQGRSVIVVDAGEPRNAPAAHMHSYLGHEGLPPSELVAIGREEVRSYGAEVLDGRVLEVTRADDDQFRVGLVGGHAVVARRVLAATGLVDELPDIEGLARHWGGDVIHCPFCHGFEVRDRHIVQIVTHPMGLHPAGLFRQLTRHLTLVLHDGVGADDPRVRDLRAAGVEVVEGRVERVVTGVDGHVESVECTGGGRIEADAIAVGPRFRVRAEPFAPLGLELADHPSGLGQVVRTDATGATSVPGLFAAGNVTDPSHQVLQAAADGGRVGGMISFSLADDDISAAARPSANETDWDHRYGGDQMWSGNPNGALVREVQGLNPGRALDVGAGEGGDAIWLAEQGWDVTANDISGRALERVDAEARRRGLRIQGLHADANSAGAFDHGAFDLVTAQYASIPRTPDGRGVRNLLDAVAPGGTLLVVSHDLAPMRAPIDTHAHSRAFDPDAYVRVDDVAAALTASPDWEVEVHERRPRPPGAASASHHVDDVVLRARRRTGPAGGPGRLVVVCGLPGSGKTTAARRLTAEEPGAVRLCPDDWMDGAGISQWDEDTRALVEASQWEVAQLLLGRGTTVVIEWGTWSRDERTTLRDGARAVGATAELVWLDVGVDELWRRIGSRTQEDPPPTRTDLENWVAAFQAPDADELASYDAVAHHRD